MTTGAGGGPQRRTPLLRSEVFNGPRGTEWLRVARVPYGRWTAFVGGLSLLGVVLVLATLAIAQHSQQITVRGLATPIVGPGACTVSVEVGDKGATLMSWARRGARFSLVGVGQPHRAATACGSAATSHQTGSRVLLALPDASDAPRGAVTIVADLRQPIWAWISVGRSQ